MKKLLLTLGIIGLFVASAIASPFPGGQIAPLDGTGVTPSGLWGGGTSLSITGLNNIDAGGTTKAFLMAYPPGMAQNFKLSADISSTTNSEVGLAGRFVIGTQNAYVLDVNFGSSTFNLIKITGGAASNLTWTNVPWVSSTGTYHIEFTVDGSNLSGSLTDGINTQTLSATDSDFTAGMIGTPLFATIPGTLGHPIQGNWTNLDFTPVPEPATISMLVLGGLAFLRRKK